MVDSVAPYSATFSTCFGAAFFPRPPKVYADLLLRRIEAFGASVFLVNTGWTGGGYGVGRRFDLGTTRAIVHAIANGALQDVATKHLADLNLDIPTHVPGVDRSLLNPRATWADAKAHDAACADLIAKFAQNFRRFDVASEIVRAGPRHPCAAGA